MTACVLGVWRWDHETPNSRWTNIWGLAIWLRSLGKLLPGLMSLGMGSVLIIMIEREEREEEGGEKGLDVTELVVALGIMQGLSVSRIWPKWLLANARCA